MLNLRELNALNREEFTRVIGPVFEHSPWVAEKTWPQQPFASREHLHKALCQTVTAGDQQSKLALIRAHPDLAGRVALTDASSREQASANLTQLSQEEMDSFQQYNRQYREKFGFPFVICARLNKKEAILAAFPIRLQNSPEQEKETALGEIFKIADL